MHFNEDVFPYSYSQMGSTIFSPKVKTNSKLVLTLIIFLCCVTALLYKQLKLHSRSTEQSIFHQLMKRVLAALHKDSLPS